MELEEFWEFLGRPRPWYRRLEGRIRRLWIGTLDPRIYWRNAKAFIQRGRRGWSDGDVYNLDEYLLTVLIGTIGRLRTTGHGYSADMDSFDEWAAVLDMIDGGLSAYLQKHYLLPIHSTKGDGTQEREGFEEAMRLITQHWESLWD